MKYLAGFCVSLGLISSSCWASEASFQGNIGFMGRAYPENALYDEQKDFYASVSFEPEWFVENKDRNQSLTLKLFGRLDSADDGRNHADVRELFWLYLAGNFELSVGARQIFWGVTESRHLVDIVNQTDFVEGTDGEDKLGQPLVSLTWISDFGDFTAYAMPYFRVRNFAGTEGRFRAPLRILEDEPRFESSEDEKHVDFAFRWRHSLSVFDIGVSYFHGTAREPILQPVLRAGLNIDVSLDPFVLPSPTDLLNGLTAEPVLIPFYPLLDQVGLDLQATLGSWLLKAESVYREREVNGKNWHEKAVVAGFEYTFYGLFDGLADLGVIGEYTYDNAVVTGANFTDDDFFVGGRFGFNDTQSSAILAGVFWDQNQGTRFYLLEANRRIGQNWKLTLDVRVLDRVDQTDPLALFAQDDQVELELQRFF